MAKDHFKDMEADVTQIETNDSSPDNYPVRAITRIPTPSLLINLSDEERQKLELRLRRKIDLRLLPMIVIMYILNYLDRNNIAAAKLAGLEKDLNLTGDQFQTSVSILFVGYLLMQGKKSFSTVSSPLHRS
jgi:hypothetical protein